MNSCLTQHSLSCLSSGCVCIFSILNGCQSAGFLNVIESAAKRQASQPAPLYAYKRRVRLLYSLCSLMSDVLLKLAQQTICCCCFLLVHILLLISLWRPNENCFFFFFYSFDSDVSARSNLSPNNFGRPATGTAHTHTHHLKHLPLFLLCRKK